MSTEELTPVTEATGEVVQAIWTFDRDQGVVILIEALAGPKRYRRVWLDSSGPFSADWTWHKPDDAVRVA